MKPLSVWFPTATARYTLWGALFGICFPLIATLLDLFLHGEAITVETFLRVQRTQPLHWIIDTAPFLLGLFARLVGRRQDLLLQRNEQLKAEIVERQRTEEAVRESEERYRTIFENAADGIVTCSLDGTILSVNRGLEKMVGWSREELIGQPYHKIAPPTSVAKGEERTRRGLAGEKLSQTFEAEIICKDGRLVSVGGLDCFIRDREGKPIGFQVIFRDITERQAVERLKDEFISTVSHELRTPLTSIRGSLGLLAGGILGPLPEKATRMVDIAARNTDRLVRLINDILDIERMQSGKITVEKATCDAADLITQAADVMRTMAEKAGVTLSAYPQSTRLWADPDRILQTLTNLLSNAIKFSPAGGTVWLTVERQGDQVMFQVRDQGRGIPADKLDSIFERFQQADIADAREKGGTGLGLAICRSIVQQHEGRIWVESTLHAGSTFFFTLPTLKEQQPEVPVLISEGAVVPKCDEEEDVQTRTPRVLVVEDDLDLARLLIAMFERHGMVTYYAQTGREALQCTQLVTFDFMVLDPVLPELDGFAVVDWLRQHERLRQVPLIVYSAQDLNAVEQQRLTLGPTRFFTKSRVTPEEFEQQTVQWLDCIMAERAAGNSDDNPRAYAQHYC